MKINANISQVAIRLGYNHGREMVRLGEFYGITDYEIMEALRIDADDSTASDLALRRTDDAIAAYREGVLMGQEG